MKLSTQPYKGARDFYPADKRVQKYMFGVLRRVVESYGYQEYDAPIIEPVDIYLAKTGEEIVNEQMYNFTDRGDRKVALRPEMTPSVSRMVAGKRQELAYPLRWYSIPNLWRYERPQRGRLREHWQLNVDLFGESGVAADHEIIAIADGILKAYGAPDGSFQIRISSRQLLNHFLTDHLKLVGKAATDAQKLIDRKDKISKEDFVTAAKQILGDNNHVAQLLEFLKATSLHALPSSVQAHSSVKNLQSLFETLHKSGVTSAVFDASIVRGLDYYTDVVFEVYDTSTDNNRAMFGGGRYDGLVAAFGVEPVPTVGFGMGDVTLQNFLTAHNLLPDLSPETDAVAILIGDVYKDTQAILADLRSRGLRLAVDATGRKLDAQIKSAVKSGSPYAIFVGESELASGKFKLKNLHTGQEKELTADELVSTLSVRKSN